jgi:acyl carrier protein
MNSEIENRIKTIIAGILCVSSDDINDSSSPRSLESWKGLNHRKIIEELEDEFSITFDLSEIDTLVNYRIIKMTILAHLS